jgi:hypothetical protein
MKKCYTCEEDKILDEYYNDKKTKDGKFSSCKKCICIKKGGDPNCYKCKQCGQLLELECFEKSEKNKRGIKVVCIECHIKNKEEIEEKTEKECTNCKQTLPLNNFHKDSQKSDGLYSVCKTCAISKTKKYTSNNKEKVAQTSKKSHQKYKNTDKCIRRRRNYYDKNKKRIDNRVKEWVKNNKEERKKILQKYGNTVNGIINAMINSARSKDKKKGLDNNMTYENIIELKNKQNNKCVYTNVELEWSNANKKFRVSLDRIDSTKGHTTENCQLVILPINYLKSNMTIEKFKKVVNALKNPKLHDSIINDIQIKERITGMKARSNKKKLGMNLDFNLLKKFILDNNNECIFSKIKLSWDTFAFNCASIDRIDSEKGYTLDNIQLCWNPINLMKSNFLTNDDVIEILELLKNNFKG